MTLLAADRLHCPPWEIDDDPNGWPYTWRARALMAHDCEVRDQNNRQREANRAAQR